MVKNQYNTSIEEWMSDAGGEYKSNTFLKALKDEGIKILQSALHTPQQDGYAKCLMCTLMDKAKAMHHAACVPQSWWEFAVLHAMHLYNRLPLHCLQWQTPYTELNGKALNILHLRVFSCSAYVHILKDTHVDVLLPKSKLMVYLSHTKGIKASTFMQLSNNTVYTSTTALFDEALFPKCPQGHTCETTHLTEPHSS
jgi:hypothetical protein